MTAIAGLHSVPLSEKARRERESAETALELFNSLMLAFSDSNFSSELRVKPASPSLFLPLVENSKEQ